MWKIKIRLNRKYLYYKQKKYLLKIMNTFNQRIRKEKYIDNKRKKIYLSSN